MPRKFRLVVKRLDLEPWMAYDVLLYGAQQPTSSSLLGSSSYPEIAPIFNKPGYYYSRPHPIFRRRSPPLCWIELNGKAYKADPCAWECSFAIVSASEINVRQADALHHIISEGLASKEQKTLFNNWLLSESVREGHRAARLWYLRNFPKVSE